MTTDNQKEVTKRSLTPLWVISLFISLTETVLGIGVIQTSGGIQIALTVFVIVFPLLIAIGFFVILWNRNYVFYAPSEYGQQDVRQYVEAMQKNTRADSELFPNIENIVRSQLSSSEIVNELTEIVSRKASERIEDEVANVLSSVAEKTLESIKDESFITIDSTPLVGGNGEIWQIPYNQYSTVSDLLDNIWYLIRQYKNIPARQYGVIWALRETKTGKIFRGIGRDWAYSRGLNSDTRSLSEVGITPGIKLEAITTN